MDIQTATQFIKLTHALPLDAIPFAYGLLATCGEDSISTPTRNGIMKTLGLRQLYESPSAAVLTLEAIHASRKEGLNGPAAAQVVHEQWQNLEAMGKTEPATLALKWLDAILSLEASRAATAA